MIDNPPQVIWPKIVKANKDHVCCECGKWIDKGSKYENVSGVWDGKMDNFKTCLTCVKVRDTLYDSYYYGELWDFIEADGLIEKALQIMTS